MITDDEVKIRLNIFGYSMAARKNMYSKVWNAEENMLMRQKGAKK